MCDNYSHIIKKVLVTAGNTFLNFSKNTCFMLKSVQLSKDDKSSLHGP